MAISRLSIDRLLTLLGAAFLIVFIVPVGVYLILFFTASAENNLSDKGQSFVQTLGSQVVDYMLLEDRLNLHLVLDKTLSGKDDARYICIVNPQGEVVSHTFHGAFPQSLQILLKDNVSRNFKFRTLDEPIMDVSAPIVSGQLGFIHVGLVRTKVKERIRQLILVMGFSLSASLMAVFIGAHFVASKVSRPLRHLESEISNYPEKPFDILSSENSWTCEVEALTRGFMGMVARLDALEDERAHTQTKMIHAERLAALGELAAGLTHEIRNPLDGMLECITFIESDPEDRKRQRKYLPMIKNGLMRIADIMQHMLTFARSGNETSLEICKTSEIVDSLSLMIEGKLKAHNMRLTCKEPEHCLFLANRRGLSQIILNLVLNAIESINGEPEPEIIIEADCDRQWVYLAVEDNGPGIPDDIQDQIFDPFYTTKPSGKGTGLGLSISRQLVRAIGGELELADKPKHLNGARFVLRLPKVMREENCDTCG